MCNILRKKDMTHHNNLEHQMRWRARNREKYLKLKQADSKRRYYWNQIIKQFRNIDPNLFLEN
jgi:hypothetical protein